MDYDPPEKNRKKEDNIRKNEVFLFYNLYLATLSMTFTKTNRLRGFALAYN